MKTPMKVDWSLFDATFLHLVNAYYDWRSGRTAERWDQLRDSLLQSTNLFYENETRPSDLSKFLALGTEDTLRKGSV